MSAIATNLRPLAKVAALPQAADACDTMSSPCRPRVVWSACGVSLLVHACLLGALSLVWILLPNRYATMPVIKALMSVADADSAADAKPFEEIAAVTHVAPPLALGGQSVGQFQTPLTSPADSLMPTGTQAQLSVSVISSPWTKADVSGDAFPAGAASGSRDGFGSGDGIGDGDGDNSGHAFFGLRPVGRRFVYVLDCSRSMNHPHDTEAKTRFKRMKVELIKSIQGMGPESEFYLIFFNDFAIPMPSPVPVQAAERPKLKYLYWMQDLKADGNTEPMAALQYALKLQPDVLYFLTDGSFTYRVEQDLLSLRTPKTEIHTFAFDAPFTENMRRAYSRLLNDDRTGARETVGSRSDYRKLVEVFKSHQFMKQMALRHGGRFRLIPYDG
ncbi:MAG: hypothetical protein O3B13_19250 [Planctomycetota bacterium]|nr:hypothetical protein [Planctomycetota bacterium]